LGGLAPASFGIGAAGCRHRRWRNRIADPLKPPLFAIAPRAQPVDQREDGSDDQEPFHRLVSGAGAATLKDPALPRLNCMAAAASPRAPDQAPSTRDALFLQPQLWLRTPGRETSPKLHQSFMPSRSARR
jgi:hypothetical protein